MATIWRALTHRMSPSAERLNVYFFILLMLAIFGLFLAGWVDYGVGAIVGWLYGVIHGAALASKDQS